MQVRKQSPIIPPAPPTSAPAVDSAQLTAWVTEAAMARFPDALAVKVLFPEGLDRSKIANRYGFARFTAEVDAVHRSLTESGDVSTYDGQIFWDADRQSARDP